MRRCLAIHPSWSRTLAHPLRHRDRNGRGLPVAPAQVHLARSTWSVAAADRGTVPEAWRPDCPLTTMDTPWVRPCHCCPFSAGARAGRGVGTNSASTVDDLVET